MAIIWERQGICRGVLILAISLLIPLKVSHAETLPELVQYLAQEHNLVKAAEEDVNAARQRARVALGDWFPNLDVSTSYGFEDQTQPGATDTRFVTRDVDLKVTQLLWDFGKTNATLRRAGLVLEQTLAVFNAIRQNVLLRGVTAYLNISRQTQVLKFAKRSEENIKKQADLENALVQAGKGFSTDVLQAKARLAGAEARRIDAHGRLEVAKNDFRAVFEREPDNIYSQGIIHLPYESMPLTQEDAVETAIKQNPGLKSESFGIQIAEEDVNSTRADSFFPRLQGVIEQRYKKDFSGTVGFQRESLGKVELTFPFNLGFTSVNRLRAARHDRLATVRRVADRKDIVEQQTRDAWINLVTSRQRTSSLRNQSEIVMRFLEDARKERKAGRRSLLDVLDGETQLLNAQSDAASAEIDEAIAIFTLFEAMGQLRETVILGRKSGEYRMEPRLSIDQGERRYQAAETKVTQKIATPPKKNSGFIFPHLYLDQADEEPKVEASLQADRETSSDSVALRHEPKQSPTTEPGISRLQLADASRAENELEEQKPPAADLESTDFDLLAAIGRFFASDGDSVDTVKSESVEAEVAEPRVPSEVAVATETGQEDPVAEAEPIEIVEPSMTAAEFASAIGDLLAGVGKLFESGTVPGKPVAAETEHAESPAPTEMAAAVEPGQEDPVAEVVEPIEIVEPSTTAAEFASAIGDLLAGIGKLLESGGEPRETTESEPVEAETVEAGPVEPAVPIEVSVAAEPAHQEDSALETAPAVAADVARPVDTDTAVGANDTPIKKHDGDELSYVIPALRVGIPETSSPEGQKRQFGEAEEDAVSPLLLNVIQLDKDKDLLIDEAKDGRLEEVSERALLPITTLTLPPITTVTGFEKVHADMEYIRDTYAALFVASGENLTRSAFENKASQSEFLKAIIAMKGGCANDQRHSTMVMGLVQVANSCSMPKKVAADAKFIRNRSEILLRASGGTLRAK